LIRTTVPHPFIPRVSQGTYVPVGREQYARSEKTPRIFLFPKKDI
jgi:hypothetical protein